MLEKLFEQSPFAIIYHKYILDKKLHSIDYFFVEANKAFYQLFGFSTDASTDASLNHFFSEPLNHSFSWFNLWNEAVRHEGTIVKRTYFDKFKLHLQIEAFKTGEDLLVTFVSKTSDIKDLKNCSEDVDTQPEDKIDKGGSKEIHLRQLILATEYSPASIVVTNRDGLIEYVNPKFTQLTGYALDEVMGKNPRVLKSGETTDEVYQNLWQTISSGKEWRGIFKNKKRDGELYIEEAVITPVFSDTGHICHYVAVKENITNRVKAEETIQQHQKKLELLLDVSQMFVSTLDLNRLVQIIVEKGAQLIDVESSAMYYVEGENLKLVASNPPLPDNVPAVFREAVLSDYPILKEAVINKKPFVLEDASKAVLSAKEQEIINHRHLKTIFYLPLVVEERVLGVLLLGTRSQTKKFNADDVDLCRTLAAQAALVLQNAQFFEKMNRVSEELILQNAEYVRVNNELEVNYAWIQEINEELKKAKEKAEESDKLKTAFLHNMSHEIRTPMNGILGFSELLRINNLSNEKRQSYISLVVDSTNRLLGIVNDIMDISRLEAGDVVLKSEPVYLNEMFNQLYQKYNQQVCNKVILESPLIDERISRLIFNSDGERLMQVLDKLLSNAVKFTPEGKIRFGCVKSNDKIRFYVEDTGIGIVPDKVELIFKPFYQIDMESTREYEGTGLGLTIASRIIEKMGSRIIVETKPGVGSRFYFDLLFQPNIYNEDYYRGDNIITNGITYAILVAEDDLINYLFIQDALNENTDGIEFVIHHARTGAEAIEKLRAHGDICLVLMDIKMPVMDGLTATRIIKREWPHIPVIAQTALALSGEHENAIDAGCDAYLTKPIRREWLIQTVYHYLKKVNQ